MDLAKLQVDGPTEPTEPNPDIVVRSYTSMGSIAGMGKVEVDAREGAIPDRQFVKYSVGFSVETTGDYAQSGATLVQYENAQKLLGALEKLEQIKISKDRFAFTEVEYEVDGLKVIVFNSSNGTAMFSIAAGGVSIHFTTLAQLGKLRSLVGRAIAHIDANRIQLS